MTQEVAQSAEASPAPETPAEAQPQTEQPAQPAESDGERKKLTGYQRKLLKKDQQIAELTAQLQQVQQAPAPQAPKEPPKAENFTNSDGSFRTDDYFKAMVTHHGEEAAKKIIVQERQQAEQQRDQQTLRTKVQKYEQAKEEIRTRHADFDDAIADYEGPESPQILMALLDTDAPADVAYYLAKNPEEARKMEGMKAHEINRHLAKIDARIELEKSQAKAPKTTNAPPPVSPVKASAKTDSATAPEDPDEYRVWRAKQRGK